MKNLLLNNLGLKLLALLLAMVTWVYVVLELQEGPSQEREALQSILPPYRLASKKVPVRLDMVGQPRDGYAVAYDKVVIQPSELFIVGPKSMLDKLSTIETEPINVTNYTKTLIKDVTVIPPTKGIITDKFISVTIPILKEK
jgi:YbbR domain-containing protein